MELKLYDDIKLNTEIEELKEKGIHKGYDGIVAEINDNECLVVFLTSHNIGEYAFARVKKEYLNYDGNNDDIKDELAAAIKKMNRSKTSFTPCDVKEYDKVELIVEKPKYAIEGVHKGMTGCVTSSYAIKGKWNIIFTENGTGKDIADICVAREDFKIIE